MGYRVDFVEYWSSWETDKVMKQWEDVIRTQSPAYCPSSWDASEGVVMTLPLASSYHPRMLPLSVVGWLAPALHPFHFPLLKAGMSATLSRKEKAISTAKLQFEWQPLTVPVCSVPVGQWMHFSFAGKRPLLLCVTDVWHSHFYGGTLSPTIQLI